MAERTLNHDHKEGCLFCELPAERRVDLGVPTFYGSYDAFPVSPGHMEVIPQRHVADLFDLEEGEWMDLRKAVMKGKSLLGSTDLTVVYRDNLVQPINDESVWFLQNALDNPNINVQPDAFNYGVNDGKAAGRTIDHAHWHIIPRYTGDMEDPRGGVRYVIPRMGNYKLPRKRG
jgi:ATP adenylyltransferase